MAATQYHGSDKQFMTKMTILPVDWDNDNDMETATAIPITITVNDNDNNKNFKPSI